MKKPNCKLVVFLVCVLLACCVMVNLKPAKADLLLWGDTFDSLASWDGTTGYHLNDTYAHSSPYSVSADSVLANFMERECDIPSAAVTATYSMHFYLESGLPNGAQYPLYSPNYAPYFFTTISKSGAVGQFYCAVGIGAWDDDTTFDLDTWYKLTVVVNPTAHTSTFYLYNTDTGEEEFESEIYDAVVTGFGDKISFNLNGPLSTPICFVDDYTVSYSLSSSPESPPSSITLSLVDLYFRSDEYTTFEQTAYGLDSSPYWEEDVDPYFMVDPASATAALGFRFWLISDDASTELTSGTPEAVSIFTEAQTSEEALTVYWTCENTAVVMGYEALKMTVYYSADLGENWAALGSFVTKPLVTNWLVSSTWEITEFIYFMPESFFVFDFGEEVAYYTGASFGISNVQIAEPETHELMMYKLSNMDLLGFILTPYVAIFGAFFYAILLVAILGAYYIWYHKASMVLFMLVLFGSAGGFVFVLLPTPANILVWVLMAVALAVLMFKVIR